MNSVAICLKTISDEKSLALFNAVAAESVNTDTLLKKLRLSRKQYYVRISRLAKAGLIKRKNGIYSLSSLGKVICGAQNLIQKAVDNYWKLKAIDSMGLSEDGTEFSGEERREIIDSLIGKESKIKDILNYKSR